MSGTTLDLHDLVTNWAKDYFERKAKGWKLGSRKERNLVKNELLGVEIDWKRVKFQYDPTVYSPPPPKPGSGQPQNNCLFHTTFANKTDSTQTYNFSAERTTRSSCTVEFEQSFTSGVDFGLTLKTPCPILEANVGFHREMTVTNFTGETIEEEMTWGVSSDISVAGGHRAEAKMIIKEEEYRGHFSMNTHVSGPVHVIFTNLKDNGAFIRACDVPVAEVMRWARETKIVPWDASSAVKEGVVVLSTRGKCTFKYGLRQDVEVDQIPLVVYV